MDSFSDPESLRGRPSVPFREETRSLTRKEYESIAEEVASHAAVGITDDDGDVLLMNDGSHGWTLVAVPVEPGEDWTAVAQREAEKLLGVAVDLERVELVRRVDFRREDDDGQRTTMYDVVFRASVDGDPVVEGADGPNEDSPSLEWFDTVPDGQEAEVADDIRLFVDG